MADLCQAIKNNDARQVGVILQRGACANHLCPDGICPLHIACGLEENDETVEIVKLLIEYGADVNYPTCDGLTPVHVAAIWGRSLTLSALLESGGDAYRKDNEGMNAVQYACQSEENSEACLVILKGFGFPLDVSPCLEETPEFTGYGENDTRDSSADSVNEITLKRDPDYSSDEESATNGIEMTLDLLPREEKPLGITKDKVSPYSSGYSGDVSDSTSVSSISESTILSLSNCIPQCSSSLLSEHSVDDKPKGGIENAKTAFKGRTFHEQSPSKTNFDCKYGCQCDLCLQSLLILNVENKLTPKERKQRPDDFLSPKPSKSILQIQDLKFVHSSLKSHDMDRSFFEISVAYDWKDLTLVETSGDDTVFLPGEFDTISDKELRERLQSYGEAVGPITEATRTVYKRHLVKLQEGKQKIKSLSRFDEYPPEIRSILSGGGTIDDGAGIEREMCCEFINPERHKWREGTRKTSFNYVLLDPRVTKDLPSRIKHTSSLEQFRSFVSAIFYIGKGKQARPYEHLYETIKTREAQCKKVSDKARVIEEIWSSGFGVLSLNVFHNVIPVEAFTREACMVDALGLQRLTNMNRGNYYGPASSWSMKIKRQLGTYLLQKALKVFVAEGERQIREHDLEK